MMNTVTFWLGVLGVIFFASTATVGALQFPEYSHVSQYISETYATGTPYGEVLRFFGYVPSGIFITVFAFLAIRILPSSRLSTIGFSGLGIFYGMVTILVAFFPCDLGCNREWIEPSTSQIIHNMAGFTTYIFVPAALIMIGTAAKNWKDAILLSKSAIFAGTISVIAIVLLFSDPNSNYVGLLQRIIESSILLWIVLCSVYIKNTKHDKN